jgi:hypothetical protein
MFYIAVVDRCIFEKQFEPSRTYVIVLFCILLLTLLLPKAESGHVPNKRHVHNLNELPARRYSAAHPLIVVQESFPRS